MRNFLVLSASCWLALLTGCETAGISSTTGNWTRKHPDPYAIAVDYRPTNYSNGDVSFTWSNPNHFNIMVTGIGTVNDSTGDGPDYLGPAQPGFFLIFLRPGEEHVLEIGSGGSHWHLSGMRVVMANEDCSDPLYPIDSPFYHPSAQ